MSLVRCGALVLSFVVSFALMGCDSGGSNDGENGGGNAAVAVTLDPSDPHQEMVGFGGAVTWFADRITSSDHQAEIVDLMFEDLGLDLLRLKNWYYPAGYPDDKTPDEMEVDWFRQHFEATNELYDLAKQHDEDIDVLLSSWTPPSALKNNGELEEGRLKEENGEFAYDAFAQYWMDALDHINFTPRYLSIQNEPDYVTPDWETSEWRPTETSEYPGYATALDRVYQRLQSRENAPTLIGPEAANLSSSSFDAFASALRDKDYVGMYGYHLYNFDESTSISETEPFLRKIPESFDDKPNLMTEYSGMGWLKTAELINNVVVEADAAGYIYWELIWADNDQGGADNAMITIDDAGEYERSPFYYVLKHFAKHVDEGDRRIEVRTEESSLSLSGYMNPSGDQLTLVVVNSFGQKNIDLSVENESIEGLTAVQSIEGSFFEEVSASAGEPIGLVQDSITTIVLDLS
jgi:glucuronoarabinoxylan endo-1,4-beta-xylanase